MQQYTETVFSVNRDYTDLDIPSSLRLRENARMGFTANLKRLREGAGLNQWQLAELVGVAQPTVQRWESGAREPKHSDLEKLAQALNVEVAQFFAGKGGAFIPPDAEAVVEFSLLGDVPAGSWQEAVQTSSNKVLVPAADAPPQGYALRIRGDSMDLVVPDGTVIIVDPHDLDLWPTKCYVVMNEHGETTFKRYLDNPARLAPCSSNEDHKDIPISGGGFRVLGRVVWQGGRL